MKAKKTKRERSPQMQQVSARLRDVLGMTQWRKEHPKATWAEIEGAVDERINQLRAQLIQDVVQMGETEDWSQKPEAERPTCATYGKPLLARGEQTRWLQTTGGEAVKLTRTYGTCPTCRVGFFPPGRGVRAAEWRVDPTCWRGWQAGCRLSQHGSCLRNFWECG